MKITKKTVAIALSLSLMLSSEIVPISSSFTSYAEKNKVNVEGVGKIPIDLRGAVTGTVFHVNTEDHSIIFNSDELKIDWSNKTMERSSGVVIPYILIPENKSVNRDEFRNTIKDPEQRNIFDTLKLGVMVLRDTDGDKNIDGVGELVNLGVDSNTLNSMKDTSDYKTYIDNKDVDDDNDGIANYYDLNPKIKDHLIIRSTENLAMYNESEISDNIIAVSSIETKSGKITNNNGPVKFFMDNLPEYFEVYEIYTEKFGNKINIHLVAKVKKGFNKTDRDIRTVVLGKVKGITVNSLDGYNRGAGNLQEANSDKEIIAIFSKMPATHGNPLNPKIEVVNKNNLTEKEKEKVKDGIKKSNPDAKNIEVKKDGSATFDDSKGNKKVLDQKDTVVEKTKAGSNNKNNNINDNIKKPALPENKQRLEGNNKTSHRVSGTTRYSTAAEVSRAVYPNGTDTVLLSNADKFSDVLTSVPYGKLLKAPILYVDYNRLPSETLNEINRLGVKKVVLIGGENTISKDLEGKIKGMNLSVSRVGGIDRYDTAKLIGEKVRAMSTNEKKDVIVASGEIFPDALSISPLSLKDELPILLVQKNKISGYTREALKELSKNSIYISGGENTVSTTVGNDLKSYSRLPIIRLSGSDRYATSAKIAKSLYPDSKISVFTSGEIFPDALVAGEIVDKYDAPLMLVKKDTVPSSVADYVKASKIIRNIIVGGTSTVTEKVVSVLEQLEVR